jgi:hypothetical protein
MVENAGYPKSDPSKKPLTDESPSISSFVDLHARRIYVSCIAKEWQPHVFDMKVIKRLEGFFVNNPSRRSQLQKPYILPD